MENLKKIIKDAFDDAADKVEFLNNIKEYIHKELSVIKQPIDFVKWIPVELVEPNDYNPNSVAKVEMGLLYKSIKHDGYTQPVVGWQLDGSYEVVDGFHRTKVAKTSQAVRARLSGVRLVRLSINPVRFFFGGL